jgi:ATP-dependent DNA helicase RecQ
MKIPPLSPAGISESVWTQATDLRRQEEAVLGEPRAFARFLTGLTSPRLTRRKLSGHRLFGVLTDVPFADVLRKAEAPDSVVVP